LNISGTVELMQIFANGKHVFLFFHGILIDSPKTSRVKNLIIILNHFKVVDKTLPAVEITKPCLECKIPPA